MKIRDVRIDGFGIWTDVTIDSLDDGITVFYGPNEAGKTTLRQFVRTVLYGFSADRRRRYLPPVHGGTPAGSLIVEAEGGTYRIERRGELNDPADAPGTVSVSAVGGGSRRTMHELLAGIDEAIFSNVFALGLRELQELSSLDATEAAQRIYSVTSGLDRVALMEVMAELHATRQGLVSRETGSSSQIPRLLAQREKLRAQCEDLALEGSRWLHDTNGRQALDRQAEDLEELMHALERDLQSVETAMHLHEKWQARHDLESELLKHPPLIEVCEKKLRQLDRLNQQILQQRDEHRRTRRDRHELRKAARELPLNQPLLLQANRVEALFEESQQIALLDSTIRRMTADYQAQLKEFHGSHGQGPPGSHLFGGSSAHSSASASPGGFAGGFAGGYPPVPGAAAGGLLGSHHGAHHASHHASHAGGKAAGAAGRGETPAAPEAQVTSQTLAALRGTARAVRDATQRLQRARQEREQSATQAQRAQQQLETALAGQGKRDLNAALHAADELVNVLRRRVQVEERLVKMGQHRQELEDDILDMMEDQVLPFSRLMWIGVPFVVGFAMLLGGLVWQEVGVLGRFVSMLGLGGLVVAIITKILMERQAAYELEDCNRQMERLNEQIDETVAERGELERQMPPGSGSLTNRLQNAEAALEELHRLVPADSDRSLASQRGEVADQKIDQATQALKAARQRWRAALRKHRLPEDLTPSQIRELAATGDQAVAAQQQVDSVRLAHHTRQRELELQQRDLAGYQRELEAISGRIYQLAQDVQVQPADDPEATIRLIHSELVDQRRYREKHETLRKQYRSKRLAERELAKTLRELFRERRQLIRSTGACDQRQLHRKLDENEQVLKLRKQVENLGQQIELAIADREDQEAIRRYLAAGTSPEELEQRRARLGNELHQAQDELAGVHQKRGALQQKFESMQADTRLAETQFALRCVDRQLRDAVHRWRVVSVTNHLLRKIREEFETSRQPRTLSDASRYFSDLTSGRYVRLWTPFGESSLRVDDASGKQSIPLEVLSSGTREAAFVSLRLALADDYARRGIRLPLVMDDVLVNLDAERAEAAVEVFQQFAAQGNQLLFFTCHEHIMEMFRSRKATVRLLPGRGQPPKRLPPPQATVRPQPNPRPEPVPAPEPPAATMPPEPEEDVEAVVARLVEERLREEREKLEAELLAHQPAPHAEPEPPPQPAPPRPVVVVVERAEPEVEPEPELAFEPEPEPEPIVVRVPEPPASRKPRALADPVVSEQWQPLFGDDVYDYQNAEPNYQNRRTGGVTRRASPETIAWFVEDSDDPPSPEGDEALRSEEAARQTWHENQSPDRDQLPSHGGTRAFRGISGGLSG